MTQCKFLSGCLFFNKTQGKLEDLLKKQYCMGEFGQCARYMIATQISREKVPPTMFPNMHRKAQEILSAG